MLVRLAFAVMIQVDADILLIDEVLAVGDAAFQQKCFDEFARIRDAGKTILLVTHDMGAVQRFCDRAMLLERGASSSVGDPERVGNRYLELNFSEAARDDAAHGASSARASASATAARRSSRPGSRTRPASASRRCCRRASRCTFAARVRFAADVEDPLFGVVLQNDRRDTVLAASNAVVEPALGPLRARARRSSYRVRVRQPARAGPLLRDAGGRAPGRRHRLDRPARAHVARVLVDGHARTDAIVDLPYDVASPPRRPRARRCRRERPTVASRLGPPIKGPSALGSDPRRLWHLTRTMAVTDFKLRFFGSVLGYLWQLVRPLLLFGVLYVVFTRGRAARRRRRALPRRAAARRRAVHVLHRGHRRRASSSLVDREALIRKIEFPRLAVPLSTVLTALFNLGAEPDRGARLPAGRRRRACG